MFIYLNDRIMKRAKKAERREAGENQLSHLLLPSPNGVNSQGWARLKLGKVKVPAHFLTGTNTGCESELWLLRPCPAELRTVKATPGACPALHSPTDTGRGLCPADPRQSLLRLGTESMGSHC